MSKADTLGSAPAFGTARSARSSRRNAIDRTVGGDNAVTAVVTELPVTVVSDNPDNPRNHLRALDETVESIRELGVILPIVVATVDAYLRDRPDRAADLDEGAQYVVVDGHRRLEASRRVGLATIPVRVDNSRVATDEALLEAAFVANYHRDDMTDLEEAHALQQLVEYYGSQTKASKRLGIAQATISSKLSLLKLAPQLQKDLMTGARTVEHVRSLGKLSPEEQVAKADERARAARQKAERTPPQVEERSAGPADYHGVIIPEPAASGSPAVPVQGPAVEAVQPEGAQQHERLPEPREAPSTDSGVQQTCPTCGSGVQQACPKCGSVLERPLKRFPYDDGTAAAGFLIDRMPPQEFDTMLGLLLQHQAKQAEAAS